jgi:hypothetical protein
MEHHTHIHNGVIYHSRYKMSVWVIRRWYTWFVGLVCNAFYLHVRVMDDNCVSKAMDALLLYNRHISDLVSSEHYLSKFHTEN